MPAKRRPQQTVGPGGYGPLIAFPEPAGIPFTTGLPPTSTRYVDTSANLPQPGPGAAAFQQFGLPYINLIGNGIRPYCTLRPPIPDRRFNPWGVAMVPGTGLGQSAFTYLPPGPPAPVQSLREQAIASGVYNPGLPAGQRVATNADVIRHWNKLHGRKR